MLKIIQYDWLNWSCASAVLYFNLQFLMESATGLQILHNGVFEYCDPNNKQKVRWEWNHTWRGHGAPVTITW